MYSLLKGILAILEMALCDYDWVVVSRHRDRIITGLMTKPRTPIEMQTFLGLSKGNKLTDTIHQMVSRKILRRLAPGIYGLHEGGRHLRKKRLKKIGQPFEYIETPGVDWGDYSWVVKGGNRVKLMRVMGPNLRRASEIIHHAKTAGRSAEDQRDNRLNLVSHRAFSVLHDLVKKDLAYAKRHSPHVSFGLSPKGEAIRKQLALA